MKVFISDIHLTDETTGRHNIHPGDVDAFWNDIQVDGIKAENIELVILGDFFDCIRSLKWTGTKQPWVKGNSTDQTTIQVVKDILSKNKQVVEKLANYFQGQITYIVGNHDRLIWRVGKAGDLVAKALNIDKKRMTSEYVNESLGIYGTHGHDNDEYNKFSPTKREAPIGDAIVTLLINKFPETVGNKMKKPKLRKALQEIDNLRPAFLAPLWIEYNTKTLTENEAKRVKKIWPELVKDFYENSFVKNWFDEYDVWYNPADKADRLQFAFDYFTDSSAKRLLDRFIEIKNDFHKSKDEYLAGAAKTLRDNAECMYILHGHTHENALHLLGEQNKKGRFYLNTGTWRRRIVLGDARKRKPLFSPIKTISYVVVYDKNERAITGTDFESWNGAIV
ncbi:MAG: hypothetical protein V3V45_07365 [Candidatus Brocadiales bacterium]